MQYDDEDAPPRMGSTSPDDAHAYAPLTPDVVLDALASVGLWGDGRLNPLASYENRVYQAWLDDGSKVVAKFYRPDRWSDAAIAEEHAFSQQLTDAEVPVVAPLLLNGSSLHHHAGFSFSVSPWRGGRQPELDDFEVLEWVGRFLARIHTVGAAAPFNVRPSINADTFGQEPHDWLIQQGAIPLSQSSAWSEACQAAIAKIRHITNPGNTAGHFAAGEYRNLRLHGDCHPGNLLCRDDTFHMVDLDDCRMGPAVQDLWMMLAGERHERLGQLSELMDGYQEFHDFNPRELPLIEGLRALRLVHYSAWLARRWDDPAFPMSFPWFGSERYWGEQILILREQLSALDEEPLKLF